MGEWTKVLITPTTPILKAIEIIDNSSMQIALVVNEGRKLVGTVTDGDIRRGILRGIGLNDPVTQVMNTTPTVAREYEERNSILAVMKAGQFNQMPIVNENGIVINLETLSDLIQSSDRDNWVILMAGGLGTRLHPLTNDCPKPLLKVGNKPILETIIQSFLEYGFRRFYLAVNYKAEMIEEYFGDGTKWGAEIRYLKENEKLGTAGALSLLPHRPSKSILVMNGDLLTKVNFQHLLDFHLEHKAQATMCVREYKFQVPYGVVQLNKHQLTGIVEKPIQQFFVSAGVYILEPDVLDFIPANTYFDMPNLFEKLIENKKETAVFPVREYWLDIGHMRDFERANWDFQEVFK